MKARMSEAEQHLRGFGRPMVTLKEIAAALGLEYLGMRDRLVNYPQLERLPAMQVGGAQMVVTENAIDWCRKHQAAWDAIQAARKPGELRVTA